MSDTQFSLLSSNSSIDFENHYLEENEYNDQETLSIESNRSVANLDEFDDLKAQIDPFLSDFMKEENEDLTRLPSWMDNSMDSGDMNEFFSSLNTDNELDNYLSGAADVLDPVEPYLDWDTLSPAITLSAQTSISNKRAFTPTEGYKREYIEIPVPTKQRRVEVSSHVRCDEWISRYHDLTEKVSFKASGMLDRRKTKHHKVLSEFDPEIQVENIDYKRQRLPMYVQKKSPLPQYSPDRYSTQVTRTPIAISAFPAKRTPIRSFTHTIRKPFVNCNHNTNPTETHITSTAHPDSPTNHLSVVHSSVDLSTSSCSSSSKMLSDVVEMPRIPAPLRMGKRVSRRGHRLSLWQFLMCLLDSSRYREHSTGIKWLNRNNGVFHIVDSKQVATLWGQYKERREKMTYDSLARSLRHYYKKNLMAKINNRRLVYQIAQECVQWSLDTFVKRNRE